jgi:hypothetical protein
VNTANSLSYALQFDFSFHGMEEEGVTEEFPTDEEGFPADQEITDSVGSKPLYPISEEEQKMLRQELIMDEAHLGFHGMAGENDEL